MFGIEQKSWTKYAACSNSTKDLFFPADNETTLEKARRERDAKAICAECAVESECLDDALERKEAHGVWGGKTASERLVIIRRSNPHRAGAQAMRFVRSLK